jgi:molybdenum cofactor sulfurtransferase
MQSRVDEARKLTLTHFNASEDDYAVIFTSGSTASIKLVGEIFPWKVSEGGGGSFCYTQNVHTSALGLRSLACNSFVVPSDVLYKPIEVFETLEADARPTPLELCDESLNIFIYPGECNFSGAKADLELVAKVQIHL